MRYVLAFDTALNGCAAALYDVSGGTSASETAPMARGHAESLVPMIGRVLSKAGRHYNEIDLIAVTVGPGAFTGLRIGLATARALGLALQRPVAGVTTTAVLARQFMANGMPDQDETLAVILETKRADFYAEFFGSDPRPLNATTADALRDGQKGKRVVCIGDALARFTGSGLPDDWRIVEGYAHPDPLVIAQKAYEDFENGSVLPPDPIYLRPPDVTLSKKPLRTLRAPGAGDA